MSFAEPQETASLFLRVQVLEIHSLMMLTSETPFCFFSVGANVPQKPHLWHINKTWRALFYDPAAELRFGGRTFLALKKT